MTRRAYIDLDFADGEHRFKLGLAELEELQEKCDAGPPVILDRLAGSMGQSGVAGLLAGGARWRTHDVTETIRIGLIGGGMPPLKALALTRRYAVPPDMMLCAKAAFSILAAALMGVDDEEVGKPEGEADPVSPTCPTENGDLLDSTETARPSE